MFGKQILVGLAMAGAAIVVWFAWSGPLRPHVWLIDTSADRLAFALKWLLVPALALMVGIGVMANRRFFSTDAMDGTRTPASSSLEINLRYIQNTLEQTVLVAVAWSLLALELPLDRLGLIPVLAVLFGVGRFAFWIGYLLAPWARAFGFALTFYPTVVALIWLAILTTR
ncbi:MAG TPA: MAPEG family protein [Rhizomicrobium sp.]|jgi:hypothetical protein|nr:MAPEG family protein [Rhizomicrobium sp.]